MSPVSAPVRLALAGVVTGAAAMAAIWALYVPIYQASDESEHFAAVVAIYAAGRPLSGNTIDVRVDAGKPIPDPAVLARDTGFSLIPFHREMKAPAGYGSVAYFQHLVRPGERIESNLQLLNPDQLRKHTPIGYYLLAALWLSLASSVIKSPVALFFVARFLNVLLLPPMLLATFGALRELGLKAKRSLLLTALVATLPVTPFVYSYVQPDGLGATLVAIALYAALRFRRQPDSIALPIAFGFAMGLLVVNKPQYWFAVALAAGGMLLVTRRAWPSSWRSRLVAAAFGFGPSLAAFGLQSYLYRGPINEPALTSGAAGYSNYGALHTAAGHGLHSLVGFLGGQGLASVKDVFLTGIGPQSFWGLAGWYDAPLLIGPYQVQVVSRLLIAVVSAIVVLLFLVRSVLVAARLTRLRRRRPGPAIQRILFGNGLTTAYVLFTLLILALEVETATTFGAPGRYWVAFLPGLLILVLGQAPRALPWRPYARAVSRLLLAGIVLYCAAATVFWLPSLHWRYYGNGRDLVPVRLDALRQSAVSGTYRLELIAPDRDNQGSLAYSKPGTDVDVAAGGQLGVAGWATDPQSGGVARTVFVMIDHSRAAEAVYGDDPPQDLSSPLGTAHDGFDAIIDLSGLALGPHSVTIEVVSADGRRIYASGQAATVRIV